MQESVVQVGSFEGGHTAIVAGLAVEDEVDGQESSAKDGTAINQALGEVSLGQRVLRCRGLVGAL